MSGGQALKQGVVAVEVEELDLPGEVDIDANRRTLAGVVAIGEEVDTAVNQLLEGLAE